MRAQLKGGESKAVEAPLRLVQGTPPSQTPEGAASAAAAQQELEVCVYVLVHSPEKAVRSF